MVLAEVLCLCLSQVGVLSNWLDELGWFLATRLPVTYPTLCYNKIGISKKNEGTSPGTLSYTLDFKNFAMHGSSIVARCCQLSWTKVDA